MGGFGSGRRTTGELERRRKILDKYWDVLDRDVDDPNAPIERKVKVAESLCGKDLGRDITINDGQETKITLVMPQDRIDDKPKELPV